MGSMARPLSSGTCLLLCLLAQLASGDREQWGKTLWWGMLGLVSLPWGSPGPMSPSFGMPANGNPHSHLRVL